MIQESFLHQLWQRHPWRGKILQVVPHQPLEIIHPGVLNTYGGPDFHAGRLRMGNQEWAGHIELHVRSSDWFRHGHNQDPAYANVILHVVWEHDEEVILGDRGPLPTLELKGLIPENWRHQQRELDGSLNDPPCSMHFPLQVPGAEDWDEMWVIRRLERRVEMWKERLLSLNMDWGQLLWEALLRSQGGAANALPFQLLGRAFPLNLAYRYRNQTDTLTALILGQAGLLNDFDAQTARWQQTHKALGPGLLGPPLPLFLWKMGGIRPAAFPALRLARMQAILQHCHPLTKLLSPGGAESLRAAWSLPLPEYWQTHYHPGRPSRTRRSQGWTGYESALLNALCPLIYLRGKLRNRPEWMQAALDWHRELPAEKNRITQKWKGSGLPLLSAINSQSALERYESACQNRQCSTCPIGQHLVFEGGAAPAPRCP
jgi:hypothetical protein